MVKFIETKNRRGLRWGGWELVFNGYRLSIGMMKKLSRRLVMMVHNKVNVLNAIGLHT